MANSNDAEAITDGRKRLGRPPLPESERAGGVIALRLAAPDRALLDALVLEHQARADSLGLGARSTPADVLRLLVRASGGRLPVVGAPAAPVPAPRSAPALPQVASSPATEDAVLSQLVKLGAEAPDGLVDAAALVRASRLPVPLAHAALEALRVAGLVELRQDTSPGLHAAEDRLLCPRAPGGGVIGYVRRIGPPKASGVPAAANGAKPTKKPAGKGKAARR